MESLWKSNVRALAGIGIGFVLASCGKTDRPGGSAFGTDAGAPAAGAAVSAGHGGGAGRAPVDTGGSVGTEAGGVTQTGGASDGGAAGECVEGAACRCGDLTGTLQCADSSEGECSCPPAEVCQGTPRSCFEPCGGNPLGVWVLEQTCFNASSEGIGCAGAFLDAVAVADSLRLEILEGEPLVGKGSEGLDVTARVPLQCLGIASVERCSGVDFYAAPLLYTLSQPLACQPSECGHCECSAEINAYAGNGYSGSGKPWEPGATRLSFGAQEVPYCVDGDTLWAGGVLADGTPKAAYRFRRTSCVGTPVPCAERQEDECTRSEDCVWENAGCSGTASEVCDFRNCDETAGCSWGAPQARCGGELASCYERSLASCSDLPGCSARTCYREHQDDHALCELLTTSAACNEAPGCTWSGTQCAGVTSCHLQTDLDVCSTLECFTSDTPLCGGYPTQQCSEFTVEECPSQPGCRLEW